ncbi:DNA topoisomerase 6 subunit B [Tanacetum coccineum]
MLTRLNKAVTIQFTRTSSILNASKCSFVVSLFPPMSEEWKSSKFSPIGSTFKAREQQERKRSLTRYLNDAAGGIYTIFKEASDMQAKKKQHT